MSLPDLSAHPLCNYFLSGYLSKCVDQTNFPSDQFPEILDRYEKIFESAIRILTLTKEQLKRKSEFNFDSGDAGNLEAGIAILRVIAALDRREFLNIALIAPIAGTFIADLICEKGGVRICLEIKAITKQSTGTQKIYFMSSYIERYWRTFSRREDSFRQLPRCGTAR